LSSEQPQQIVVVGTVTTTQIQSEQPQQQPLDQNPAAVYLASLSKNGRVTMRSSLNQLVRLYTGDENADCLSFPWQNLRYQHTTAIRTLLKDKYSPGSANTILCGMRRVLKEAWRLGLITSEDFSRAVDLAGIRAETLPRGRALAVSEVSSLIEFCKKDTTPVGVRDSAVIIMLYGTGLRRSELANLKLADVDVETGEVKVFAGKGHKDRVSYLPQWALPALTGWIKVRGSEAGPLFYQSDKTGGISQKVISDEVVMRLLKKRVEQAGIKHCSPHDLRRTFVSELLDQGVDIATVQKLAGHADIATTARYDRRGEVTKRKAVNFLKVPAAMQ